METDPTRIAVIGTIVTFATEAIKRAAPKYLTRLDDTDVRNFAAVIAVLLGAVVNVGYEALQPTPNYQKAIVGGLFIGAGAATGYKVIKDGVAQAAKGS